jgi:hypothetical protein
MLKAGKAVRQAFSDNLASRDRKSVGSAGKRKKGRPQWACPDTTPINDEKLDQASGLENTVSTVFVHGLECTGGQLDGHKLTQFRNPDALGAKIWINNTLHTLGDVLTDTTLFLRFTAAMNVVTACDADS